jgi:thymidine phosphorylase
VEDPIDPGVGLMVLTKPGRFVEKGQEIIELRYRDGVRLQAARPLAERAIAIEDVPGSARPLILGHLS